MTTEEAHKVIEPALERYRHLLQLHDWTIALEYVPDLPEGQPGEANVDSARQRATIRINPNELQAPEQAKFLIRHELLHAFAADFHAYAHVAARFEPRVAQDAMAAVQEHHIESLIRRLERLLDALDEPLAFA